MLTVAGIALAESDGKRTVYCLHRHEEMAHAIAGMPERFPDWAAIYRVIEAIQRYALAPSTEGQRARQAAAAVTCIDGEVPRIHGAARPPRVTDEASIVAFEEWAGAFVRGEARAPVNQPAHREVVYTVHRLLLGG
jgi:hypothetical protein